ncbi:hypothetical protein A2U01_0028029, partial [Trifolium medium]|nr:hypothetical protein [Trifolium medium]
TPKLLQAVALPHPNGKRKDTINLTVLIAPRETKHLPPIPYVIMTAFNSPHTWHKQAKRLSLHIPSNRPRVCEGIFAAPNVEASSTRRARLLTNKHQNMRSYCRAELAKTLLKVSSSSRAKVYAFLMKTSST